MSAVSSVALTTERTENKRLRRSSPWTSLAFLAPFLVIFAAFFIVPLVYSLYISLYSSQLVGGEVPVPWAGLLGLAQQALCLVQQGAGPGVDTTTVGIQLPLHGGDA